MWIWNSPFFYILFFHPPITYNNLMKWNGFCVRAKGKKQNKTISFENSLPLLFLFFCLCVSSTIEKNVVNILIATGWYNNYTYIIPYYILLFNVSCLLLLVICVCTCVCFCPTVLIVISSVSIHFFHIFLFFLLLLAGHWAIEFTTATKTNWQKKLNWKKKKFFTQCDSDKWISLLLLSLLLLL
jgi:hypothetical protein